MLSKTYQSGKPQAPCFSLVGRNKKGSFHEDLKGVSDEINFAVQLRLSAGLNL